MSHQPGYAKLKRAIKANTRTAWASGGAGSLKRRVVTSGFRSACVCNMPLESFGSRRAMKEHERECRSAE